MLKKLSIKDLPLKGQKVLMRVDFNVPLDKSQKITDDTRIKATLPTIEYILKEGGSVILMSHLGRPKGKKNPEFSLKPCAQRLSELLKKEVLFASDCLDAKDMAASLKPGDVLLLENLRFYPAEEKPDVEFVKTLASYGTVYVNDAFGTAHRAHASTVEVAKAFPKKAAAGFLLEKELNALQTLLERPKKPFIAIIGGAKISSKIGVLKALLEKVDALLIGGGMAYTFMKAEGVDIGNSLFEEEFIGEAKLILAKAKERKIPLILPSDHVIVDSLDEPKNVKTVVSAIPKSFMGVDIGPKTIAQFKDMIDQAGTVFWNGPLGVFENKRFSLGTFEIAKAIAEASCISVVGGGDSIAAINEIGLGAAFTHISTGGGATLEYIEHGTLPGIDILSFGGEHSS